jgi:uncharacterized protein YjbJ (UPF0337 family)
MKGDKNIVEGKLKQAEGKLRDAYGDLTGNLAQDVKGKIKQVEGKIQESFGHAQNAAQESKDRDQENPRV